MQLLTSPQLAGSREKSRTGTIKLGEDVAGSWGVKGYNLGIPIDVRECRGASEHSVEESREHGKKKTPKGLGGKRTRKKASV